VGKAQFTWDRYFREVPQYSQHSELHWLHVYNLTLSSFHWKLNMTRAMSFKSAATVRRAVDLVQSFIVQCALDALLLPISS